MTASRINANTLGVETTAGDENTIELSVGGSTVTTVDGSGLNVAVGDIKVNGSSVVGSDSIRVPAGTTGERPASPVVGEFRYNTDNSEFEQYDGSAWVSLAPPIEKGSLDKTFTFGESASISLSEPISGAPIVSVIKEVPQTGVTSNEWDVRADGANYTLHDTAYNASLTPSNATGNGTFTLGSGAFASTDVGKRIVGNGGEAILTATDGSYELQSDFLNASTIAAGDWSMFGLDIESDDAGLTLSGISRSYDIENTVYNNSSFDPGSGVNNSDVQGLAISPDGSNLYVVTNVSDLVAQYELVEPFDLSTAVYNNKNFDASNESGGSHGVEISNQGDKMYIVGAVNQNVYQYTLTTPYDVTTASYDNVSLDVSSYLSGSKTIRFSEDGLKTFILGSGNQRLIQFSLSTAFDLSTASSSEDFILDLSASSNSPVGFSFNNTGTEFFVVDLFSLILSKYVLTSPFDLSSASLSNESYDLSAEVLEPADIVFNSSGTKFYVLDRDIAIYEYVSGEFVIPTSANHTAITTASTDTEFWTDINSMTADDSVNDGSVYYAVSTDGRTTWSIIDDTEGVRNIVRNNAGTWEVNDASDYSTETWVAASENDEFYALEEAVDVDTAQSAVGFAEADTWSYDSVSFSVGSENAQPTGIAFNTDGTKMYMVGINSTSVHEYNLSAPFDLSTASYNNVSFDPSSQDIFPQGIKFNSDGTKMYMIGSDTDSVYQYSLTTAFDLNTVSYDNVSFDVLGQSNAPQDITFNNDGTKMYIVGRATDSVYQYTLSTSFDLSTASYDNVSFDVSSQAINPSGVRLNNEGTKMYIIGYSSESVHQYGLTTAFDLSTASYDNVSFSVLNQDGDALGVAFNAQGTKMYMIGNDTDSVYQYSSGTTTSTNRMDATQLNAVSDANHYTLGNDLDLAITLFMADGNTNSPTSDGVSINYDANVVNQAAVLGTDYEFDKPTNSTVRIKALSDENFKVRVV